MKNPEKVLKLIEKYPDGIDDDEIADKAGIQPRQQVYQICKRLEMEGKIRRQAIEKTGKRRKIHNFPNAAGNGVPPRRNPFAHVPLADDKPWHRNLVALTVATGREMDDLLSEAIQDLAMKIVKATV